MPHATREASVQLVAFRRTLVAVIGSSHRDYQQLRSRIPAELEDDEDDAATEPTAASAQPEVRPVTTQSEVGIRVANGH